MNQTDILLEITRNRIEAQTNSFRLVTSKASVLIGFATVFAAAPVPTGAYGTDWLWAMNGCIVGCLVCALGAILPRKVREPDLKLIAMQFGINANHAKQWLIDSNINAYKTNKGKLALRTIAFYTGFSFFVIALCIYLFLKIKYHG